MNMCIRMDAADNVATVLEKTCAGDKLNILDRNKQLVGHITAKEEIPFAHKISIKPIEKGELIYKFGVVVGRCIETLPEGGLVHVHNLISIKGAEQIRRARE